jgi:hypothetical protein
MGCNFQFNIVTAVKRKLSNMEYQDMTSPEIRFEQYPQAAVTGTIFSGCQ